MTISQFYLVGAMSNDIKALSLEATWITDNSLKTIKQHLNLTLEELSLGPDDRDTISLEPYGHRF